MWGGKKIKYWWKEPLIFPESLSGALPCSLNPHAQSVWKIAAGLETVIHPESEDGETSLWAPHRAPAAVLQLSSAVCHGCLLMGVFFGLGFLFWLLILFWFNFFFFVFVFLKSFFVCVCVRNLWTKLAMNFYFSSSEVSASFWHTTSSCSFFSQRP